MELTINTAAAQVKLSGLDASERTAKTEKTENTEAAEASAAETPAVQTRKFDTVELSTEAEQYLTEDTSADNTGVNILEEYTSESTSDSTDSDSLDELYTYTDNELADLLRDGEITQTQYNTEMAKRTTTTE